MEVARIISQGRISERVVVQTDEPVPQTLEEVVEVVKAVNISVKICEQIVGAPVPHAVDELVPPLQEETFEVIKLFPEEHTPRRIIQGFTPQERISERIHEQTVDQPGDMVVDMLVVMQRQVPRIQTVLKTMEAPINQATKHAQLPKT